MSTKNFPRTCWLFWRGQVFKANYLGLRHSLAEDASYGINYARKENAPIKCAEGENIMVAFFIGLAVGTVVGIVTMCLLMINKQTDRLDVGSTP